MTDNPTARRTVVVTVGLVVLLALAIALTGSYLRAEPVCNTEHTACLAEAGSLAGQADCMVELYHCRAFGEHRISQ